MSDHPAIRPPTFSVIIVSYRVRDLLRACLRSIQAQQGALIEVWVVDNASGDGSAEMVAAEFPDVRLVRSEENLGFARANNLALAKAKGDFLALVNPDTELPSEALACAADALRRHPRAGAVGLSLCGREGRPQPSCHAFPGVWNVLIEALLPQSLTQRWGLSTMAAAREPAGGEGEVDWVAGAFMVLTREAYGRVGGLHEGTFLYGEEMDWSWRARQAGFATIHSATACVLHHGGASGAGLQGELFARNLDARLSFLSRHRGAWRAAIAREILFVASLSRWLMWSSRAAIERLRGGARPHTRHQVERFAAAVRWRLGERP